MDKTRLLKIREERIKEIKKLRELGINPYPSRVNDTPEKIEDVVKKEGCDAQVAGRIFSIRSHGSVIFADIKDETGKIQLWFQKKNLRKKFAFLKYLHIGDFLFAKGKVEKTIAGEISLNVYEFQFLAKSLRPLPSKWHGLKDIEERFRKRYLDLILNPEVRERFNIRTKLIKEIRSYLDSLGFWEVETPTLQPLYGGANAKPFKTYHNALDYEFYLRIADELYLKRLIVGGYQRVYEICKDFRNEGIDRTHSPEFTMIEFYEAYADYQRIMDITEGLFKHLARKVLGTTILQIEEHRVDIGKEWPRKKMVEIIKEMLNIEVESVSREELFSFAKKNGLELLGGETKGQLIYLVFEHLITDKLIDPVWVIDYPRDVSPLSKAKEGERDWVERFEGYVGGKEICDGWSELTDPLEQRERFEKDLRLIRKDKEEAQQVDEDFLEAMEYGMPPLGGIGIGIDRLVMFYTNTWSIKEVILFPTLRPQNERKNKIKR